MIFGSRSLRELNTCHKDLQLIHNTAIKDIKVDYGIHEGARSFTDQLNYFLNNKSKIDPRVSVENAKHVIIPDRPKSLATDIHISTSYKKEQLIWHKEHLVYVIGYLMGVADQLYNNGLISHKLRSGADWDGDGIIGLDQSFDDYPHLELIKP